MTGFMFLYLLSVVNDSMCARAQIQQYRWKNVELALSRRQRAAQAPFGRQNTTFCKRHCTPIISRRGVLINIKYQSVVILLLHSKYVTNLYIAPILLPSYKLFFKQNGAI